MHRTAHKFHPTILREYDVRGIIGQTLSEQDAFILAKAFGTVIRRGGGGRVAVGYDGRLSSPALADAVVTGLSETGIEVVRIGRGPTPMLYYAAKTLPADGGIMITGSHNPPDHNGFKMVAFDKPFFGESIRGLGRLAEAADFEAGAGGIGDRDLKTAYVQRLLEEAAGLSDLPKTVWDAGNGAAGEVLADLCAALPGEHIVLFDEVDGTFPNHHPDPTVEQNLVDLRAKVAETGAELGIAFDGDGDRIGVIDARGRILWGDQLMQIFARDVLADRPGATIIADVKASRCLFDVVAGLGGRPLMWKTGHSLIKQKMAETGAPAAGEMSGHLFFADRYYGFDDALYAAVRFLRVLTRIGDSAGALVDQMPKTFSTPEIRIACDEARKFAVIGEVAARLNAQKADVNTVDGVRVQTDIGWWLLRASNTQAVLVARAEARDQAGLDTLVATVKAQLARSGIDF